MRRPELSHEEYRQRQSVQTRLMRRYCSAVADYSRWATDGCAAEFDRCWSAGMRDEEAIYTSCLASRSRAGINAIL